MIVLAGAELILPDRIVANGTVAIEGPIIADVRSGAAPPPFALHGHYIVPGFVDVHVHGVEGVDLFDGDDAVRLLAERLPRYGVTAFCPTTIACDPASLARVLALVGEARALPRVRSARVLAAHLESNFINPLYAGAQPIACLCTPRAAFDGERAERGGVSGADILTVIERGAPDVGIVTLAPEIDGGHELVARLVAVGHRVSLGHSGATYDEAVSAIAAGARHATHLFNRMPPLHHREPGLAGAVIESREVAAEVICDGVHVHPALVRATLAAKGASRVMAITDGTALSGLPPGSRAQLGGRAIVSDGRAARLPDGTLAGSTLTMDRAFRTLVAEMGVSLVDAAALCSTTPARELGLVGHGVLATGAVADLVVLDRDLSVVQTYVAGRLVYARSA